MTPDRTSAYARVMRRLDAMGPAKLHEIERRCIRNCADTLVLADGLDAASLKALADIEHMTRHLAACGRLTAETAEHLADEVAACGAAWFSEEALADHLRAA